MPETWMHVAEKPSVAKEAARVLSGGHARVQRSVSPMNPIYEFQMQGNTWLFTSVAGHMMEDEFPPHTKSWSGFPFAELFDVPIHKSVKEDHRNLERNLQELARKSQRLVLWLDCDREGENIAFEVKSVVDGVRGPNFPCSRAHFSALTARDLQHAIAHLVAPDRNMSDAVDTRQEMDLRIGAAFTRFQTVSFRDEFADMPKVISFGPCQMPCLGFVVQRHWEREAFVSEKFFHATMTDNSGGSNVNFQWRRGNIYDAQAAAIVASEMFDRAELEDHVAKVSDVQQKQTRRAAPHPLATVELQKLASQHLRMASERCMKLAEELYQEGAISYPRTETDNFTFTDDELKDLVRQHYPSGSWGAFARRIVEGEPALYKRPTPGGHDDKAHPPIHPLKLVDLQQGSEKARLYELICRHFLACCSLDAIAANTQVTAVYGGEEFGAGGQTIVARNWIEVFTYTGWSNTTVPNYQVGDTFKPTAVRLDEGETQPPGNLTEVNLIAMMDEFGIGTDATIAQHIKTVQDRAYVTVNNGVFTPTPLGLALVAAYDRMGLQQLWQPQLRAQLEAAMGDIARGRATKQAVLASAVQQYKAIFLRVLDRKQLMRSVLVHYLTARAQQPAAVVSPTFTTCGRCGGATQLCRSGGTNGDFAQVFARCTTCSLDLKLPGKGNLTPHGHVCPICRFGVATVTNTETGRTHTVCTYCFSHPPRDAIADIESAAGDFRCFQCTRADCALSGGTDQITVAPCRSCGGQLKLKKGTRGAAQAQGPSSFFVGCKAYPQCNFTAFLPGCANAVPSQERCGQCNALQIEFQFASMVQTPPGMDLVDTACVFCDGRLAGFVQVRGGAGGPPGPPGGGGVGIRPAAPVAATDYVMPEVADAHPRRNRGGRGGGARGGRGGQGAGGNGRGGGKPCDVKCDKCGGQAIELTSRKEQSAGKKFAKCPAGCDFFKWIDA